MPETVLSRFLRYVKIYTTSDPDSHTTPSTERQWVLLRMLAAVITIDGVSTHPGEGRKYKMVSALMLAARLLAALLVENQSAETTDGRG
jgi:di/tripeptidase